MSKRILWIKFIDRSTECLKSIFHLLLYVGASNRSIKKMMVLNPGYHNRLNTIKFVFKVYLIIGGGTGKNEQTWG